LELLEIPKPELSVSKTGIFFVLARGHKLKLGSYSKRPQKIMRFEPEISLAIMSLLSTPKISPKISLYKNHRFSLGVGRSEEKWKTKSNDF